MLPNIIEMIQESPIEDIEDGFREAINSLELEGIGWCGADDLISWYDQKGEPRLPIMVPTASKKIYAAVRDAVKTENIENVSNVLGKAIAIVLRETDKPLTWLNCTDELSFIMETR